MGNVDNAKYSLPSIIAIVSAVASLFVGAGLGLLLASVAILFGLIGILMAFSSRIRGGIMSVFSIFAGLIGIIAAIFKIAF